MINHAFMIFGVRYDKLMPKFSLPLDVTACMAASYVVTADHGHSKLISELKETLSCSNNIQLEQKHQHSLSEKKTTYKH